MSYNLFRHQAFLFFGNFKGASESFGDPEFLDSLVASDQ